MSDAPRRRKVREVEIVTKEELLSNIFSKWEFFIPCRREGFVNCAFGEKGPCLTPRHAREG